MKILHELIQSVDGDENLLNCLVEEFIDFYCSFVDIFIDVFMGKWVSCTPAIQNATHHTAPQHYND